MCPTKLILRLYRNALKLAVRWNIFRRCLNVYLEETLLLNMNPAWPQLHNYFILWFNVENSMTVFTCLGRVFKTNMDICRDLRIHLCSSLLHCPRSGLGLSELFRPWAEACLTSTHCLTSKHASCMNKHLSVGCRCFPCSCFSLQSLRRGCEMSSSLDEGVSLRYPVKFSGF